MECCQIKYTNVNRKPGGNENIKQQLRDKNQKQLYSCISCKENAHFPTNILIYWDMFSNFEHFIA